MSSFNKEMKKRIRKLWLTFACIMPIILVVSVLLVYASVPFYLNTIISTVVGLVVFLTFQIFYDIIERKKKEKIEANKGKDPFAN